MEDRHLRCPLDWLQMDFPHDQSLVLHCLVLIHQSLGLHFQQNHRCLMNSHQLHALRVLHGFPIVGSCLLRLQ